MVENESAHTFDVSDLDDARDTAPVLKVALDSISAASSAGNSADGQVRHGVAEVTSPVAVERDWSFTEPLTITITRLGRSVTLLIAADESDEAVAARVAQAINHAKDEILW